MIGRLLFGSLIASAACASPISGLGVQVLAIPGTTWSFGFTDLFDYTAGDFNAAVGTISFGLDDTAVLNYLSSDSPNVDLLRVATLGDYGTWIFQGQSETYTIPDNSPSSPVVYVEMLDSDPPYGQYSTGPANLNPDDLAHAWVQETPEPAEWLLTLCAFIWCVMWKGVFRRA